ncbi:MAG TPA: FAD-dependent oxidoreductase, partial [Candidatus Mediterraneibacter faecigallinarum]|nr:FAD-dependent oxidoreductase [Candidatus Mediterraneibacter faecigallinarum]
CTRNFYEEPVYIRGMKLIAAENGYDALMEKLETPAVTRAGKAAVIGGGPAGMAAAYFLRRAGMEVTLFEKNDALGGVVRHVIPEFRIPGSAIDKDAALLEKMGVNICLNSEISEIDMLKNADYTAIVVAAGASEPGVLRLEKGEAVNALKFLADFKAKDGDLDIGKNVVIIGGGNTAMDTARAAKRTKGVEHAYLVYRRTKRYMPADEEELVMAVEDGVEFMELLAPVKLEDGKLLCKVMKLGDYDASGRRGVVETGEEKEIPADTVIAAVGERVPAAFYKANGIAVNDRGRAIVNEETLETNLPGVYVVGDGLGGPATVVEGIRDGLKAAEAIIGSALAKDHEAHTDEEAVYEKRGILADKQAGKEESGRCLGCSGICENCTEVCPNRANIAIRVPGMEKHQIIHVDYMCNECGNCRSFCPYDSAPYLDKFTLFADEKDMEDSSNQGFVVLDREAVKCKVRFFGETSVWTKGEETRIPDALQKLMETVCMEYSYLLRP